MSHPSGEVNYPDVLGAITRGPRLNLGIIQAAMTIRPVRVPAGRFFDVLLLVQNAADIDVDVVASVTFPGRGHAALFKPVVPRLRVGLQPAEVGYVTLPVASSPTAPPTPDYVAELQLDIKPLGKKPQRVRATTGGGAFHLTDLPDEVQAQIADLRELVFSVTPGRKKNRLQAPFAVAPPTLTRLSELKGRGAAWASLWTLRDHLDAAALVAQMRDVAEPVLRQLTRDRVFIPLLKTTQTRFERCGYHLLPPEAIFITKVLTLVLENSVDAPPLDAPQSAWPRWFTNLCRLLHQQPALAERPDALVADPLYLDVVHDATIYAFSMVHTVTGENFGTEEEIAQYADGLVQALDAGQPVDMARAYLPLVMAGVIANQRVTMPREQVRETVFTLLKALEKRRPEQTPENTFVFDITRRLIDRALDML